MTDIDFSKVATFSNGVKVLNCTPHKIVFRDGDDDITIDPCGAVLKASAKETPAGNFGNAALVSTVFETTLEGTEELQELENNLHDCLFVGSLVSAQAYAGRVVAMTPAPGFERVPVEQKRMSVSKFTIF